MNMTSDGWVPGELWEAAQEATRAAYDKWIDTAKESEKRGGDMTVERERINFGLLIPDRHYSVHVFLLFSFMERRRMYYGVRCLQGFCCFRGKKNNRSQNTLKIEPKNLGSWCSETPSLCNKFIFTLVPLVEIL